MSVTRYIDPAGTVIELSPGPRGPAGSDGTNGTDGTDGASAYDLWLADGNTGTLQDFFRDVAPDVTPSQASAATSDPAYTVPAGHSLVTLDVAAPVELSVGDFVSSALGTNPDGYSFTLHLTGAPDGVTFAGGITVHGTIPVGAAHAWATVMRESGAWVVLVGATA